MCNILSREAAKKKAAICRAAFFETICSKLFRWRGCGFGPLLRLLAAFVMALGFCGLLAAFMRGSLGLLAAGRLSAGASAGAACLSKCQDAANYQSARDCE